LAIFWGFLLAGHIEVLLREEFDGYVATQAGILSQPHFPHAARAEFFENLIMSDALTDHGRGECNAKAPGSGRAYGSLTVILISIGNGDGLSGCDRYQLNIDGISF